MQEWCVSEVSLTKGYLYKNNTNGHESLEINITKKGRHVPIHFKFEKVLQTQMYVVVAHAEKDDKKRKN